MSGKNRGRTASETKNRSQSFTADKYATHSLLQTRTFALPIRADLFVHTTTAHEDKSQQASNVAICLIFHQVEAKRFLCVLRVFR